MSTFDQGLDVVLDALRERRAVGAPEWRVNLGALRRLEGGGVGGGGVVVDQEAGGEGKAERLARLRACPERLPCARCPYGAGEHGHIVFGVGSPDAELMFVGEAPGADEDAQGEPFVGKAGQLLTKIIGVMGYRREDVYIANIVKCRPDTPGQTSRNRAPTPEEMESCRPALFEQIEIVAPRVIVALGATAMRGLLGSIDPMRDLRGRWHDFRSTPVMATYHPSYLLRNQSPAEKRKVWEDMLLVKERLGHTLTERDRGYFLARG